MNSLKLTNILLLVLVLLLCLHVGLETFRPLGRYVRWSAGSAAAVLDTASGTVYLEDGSQGQIVNIVRVAKKLHNKKSAQPTQAAPDAPNEYPSSDRP